MATASFLIIFGRFVLWAYHCNISAPLILPLYRGSRRSSAVSCEVELASCETRNVSEFYKAERSTDFLLAVMITFNGLPRARSSLTLSRAHPCVVRGVHFVCSCILIFLSSLSPIPPVLHFLCSSCDDSWRYGSD